MTRIVYNFLRKRGWRHLDDLTLSDVQRVCRTYGIVVRPHFEPAWAGAWKYDRGAKTWRRPVHTSAGIGHRFVSVG